MNNKTIFKDTEELTYLRALLTVTVERFPNFIRNNEDTNRDIYVLYTTPIKIKLGMYLMFSIKANMVTRTTIPYVDILEVKEEDLESEVKEVLTTISTQVRNTISRPVGTTKQERSTIYNEMRVKYNTIADTSRKFDELFLSDSTSMAPFTSAGQIVKNMFNDVEDILSNELDDDVLRNFRRSKQTIELDHTTVIKRNKDFIFNNGLIVTVNGYNYKKDTYKYLSLSTDYKLKREVKNDSLY